MLKRMQSGRAAQPAPALTESPAAAAPAIAATDAAPAAIESLGPPAPQIDVVRDVAVTTTTE
jgi:hypothetical protein